LTVDQIIVFAILAGVMALLIWGRLRYDLIALTGLLAAVVTGVVKPEAAFHGFGNDIVIIVGSALVVSAAVARSGIAEALIRPVAPRLKVSVAQIAALTSTVAVLSAFMKNIGALAILIPIAFQLARRTGKPVSRLLMPMSFAALLGGMVTLIGTSPNIVVSSIREETLGRPFAMFDFLPVGLPLTVLGLIFLLFGWRLLPRRRETATGPEAQFSIEDYQAEVRLPPESPYVGKSVRDLEDLGEGDVTVAAIIREKYRRYVPSGHWELFADDVLVLECDAHALAKIAAAAKLELIHDEEEGAEQAGDRTRPLVEAVITPSSVMIGHTVEELHLRDRYGFNLLAISRRGDPIGVRLRRVRFQPGDLVVLRGSAVDTAERLAALGCLPLAERYLRLGRKPHPYAAPAILAIAMALAATGLASVAVAFFGAAVAVLLVKALTLEEAYSAVDWPILVLLGALIPVSESLETSGGAELIAGLLSGATEALPPMASLALVMVAAMGVTPFLNNAATVLIMAPIGVSLAGQLGLNPDPFLMAVAIGSACDFLTPIGHQCNTLVMGPGGYRFGDYWRLGLPLSLLVVVAGAPLIALFWPLQP
jgi:di/tricarboxylate transporter